ncbi:MAG: DegV family protein [Xanthomonadaceae bacterium]|nr:DegV family protein [Xanthomonadaceae bacterium]
MRIGLVVDAGCDLPDEMIADENVVVLPIAVRIGDHMTLDTRNSDVTRQFMESDIAKDAAEAETIPYTVEQIRELFLTRLVHEYDYVFCQTIAASRSPIYERAVQASFGILNDYHEVRRAAGNNTPFALRVQDTGNLFAGQALSAWDTLRLRKAGESPMRIRTRLERVANATQGIVVTPDLYYMRNRGRKKGDRSVGLMSAMLGTALDVKPMVLANRGNTAPVAKVRGFEPAARKLYDTVILNIRDGLLVDAVCLSYAGELDDMRNLPGYDDLVATCSEHGVELIESMMGLTGVINIGKGSLTAAYSKEGPFKLG